MVYLERTIFIRASSKSGIRFSYMTSFASLFLVCSGSLLWFATLFIDSFKVAEIMTKLGCAMYATACAILAVSQAYLFTKYIGDVKALIASSGDSPHEVGAFGFNAFSTGEVIIQLINIILEKPEVCGEVQAAASTNLAFATAKHFQLLGDNNLFHYGYISGRLVS